MSYVYSHDLQTKGHTSGINFSHNNIVFLYLHFVADSCLDRALFFVLLRLGPRTRK
ncbi:unnamed protein product [Ixodes persulcatus]